MEFPVSVCKDHTVKQRSYKHLCKQSLEIVSSGMRHWELARDTVQLN